MSQKENTEAIKVKVFSNVGTPDKIYPEMIKIRKENKVLEEITSLNPFEVPQPKLQGLHSIAPQMGILISYFIVCEDQHIIS